MEGLAVSQGYVKTVRGADGNEKNQWTDYYKSELKYFAERQVRRSIHDVELAGLAGVQDVGLLSWVSRRWNLFTALAVGAEHGKPQVIKSAFLRNVSGTTGTWQRRESFPQVTKSSGEYCIRFL